MFVQQEREQSPEPKEAQPKTFYIAREILTTERTYVYGLCDFWHIVIIMLFHRNIYMDMYVLMVFIYTHARVPTPTHVAFENVLQT